MATFVPSAVTVPLRVKVDNPRKFILGVVERTTNEQARHVKSAVAEHLGVDPEDVLIIGGAEGLFAEVYV